MACSVTMVCLEYHFFALLEFLFTPAVGIAQFTFCEAYFCFGQILQVLCIHLLAIKVIYTGTRM
jgi:hypothetical protein